MAGRDTIFSQLFDDLTKLHEELSSDPEGEATQHRVRSYLAENQEAVRESFRLWAKLGHEGRNDLHKRHRQLDESAVDDGFRGTAEHALAVALDEGELRFPVTDDDVNMIRRAVNYAAHSPDAERSDVHLQR